jgi:uncharacterized membrane protein YeaQ/YmgE (transglycosylase-associated protein family)
VIWWLIVTLVGGLIIGWLGKLVAPGDREHIPLWLTVACGIGGMLIGSLVYYWLFGVSGKVKGDSDYGWDNTTKGIDWWRHVWQVAAAAVLVVIASSATGRRKTTA